MTAIGFHASTLGVFNICLFLLGFTLTSCSSERGGGALGDTTHERPRRPSGISRILLLPGIHPVNAFDTDVVNSPSKGSGRNFSIDNTTRYLAEVKESGFRNPDRLPRLDSEWVEIRSTRGYRTMQSYLDSIENSSDHPFDGAVLAVVRGLDEHGPRGLLSVVLIGQKSSRLVTASFTDSVAIATNLDTAVVPLARRLLRREIRSVFEYLSSEGMFRYWYALMATLDSTREQVFLVKYDIPYLYSSWEVQRMFDSTYFDPERFNERHLVDTVLWTMGRGNNPRIFN